MYDVVHLNEKVSEMNHRAFWVMQPLGCLEELNHPNKTVSILGVIRTSDLQHKI